VHAMARFTPKKSFDKIIAAESSALPADHLQPVPRRVESIEKGRSLRSRSMGLIDRNTFIVVIHVCVPRQESDIVWQWCEGSSISKR
jgi:hypothetical protein